ncbi:hypothetical protein [Synoicihabitans lomoniglobus]|uniref:Uncharacterized protein n=1 Tax=Synoicihabitans lomoniglobus TaxID=2909285 RepID=A0AAF0CQY6_9BACT|nr:hypothetical protein [Opitutaceae bacterium LMO-M01]WED66424.1 hypothetical protein PXH66_06130 [Opitutaceae bacterium LMO-M01]
MTAKTKKTSGCLVAFFVGFLVMLGSCIHLTRTGQHKHFYDRISIGMPVKEAEEILRDIPVSKEKSKDGTKAFWLFWDPGPGLRNFYNIHFENDVVVWKDFDR